MIGSSPYITLDLCMPPKFLHYSSLIIIHFNLFEHLNRVIVKFDRVIHILELKKNYCVTQLSTAWLDDY